MKDIIELARAMFGMTWILSGVAIFALILLLITGNPVFPATKIPTPCFIFSIPIFAIMSAIQYYYKVVPKD